MQIKVLTETPERTMAAVFDSAEEAAADPWQIAVEQNLTAARLTGIGALSRVVLGYFDLEKREYRHIEIDDQVEVLSLIGNIALHGAEKRVHAHIVVGKSDGTAHAGHLLKGWVQPAIEVLIVESPGFLARQIEEATGLPLITI